MINGPYIRPAASAAIAFALLVGFVAPAVALQWTDNNTTLGNGCKIKSRQTDDGFLGVDWAETWENNACTFVEAQVGSGIPGSGNGFAFDTGSKSWDFTVHRGFKNGVIKSCVMSETNVC